MTEAQTIRHYLQQEFHADFVVEKNISANEEYVVRISKSGNRYFFLKITIKDNIRLTIVCEPEQYAASFIDSIDSASIAKREMFCKYWELLGEKNVNLKINDNASTIDSVINKLAQWKRFNLRYTKAPFCNETLEDKYDVICHCAKLIISMVLALTDYRIEGEGFEEGAKRLIEQTKYERNPVNRELCLLAKGYTCSVCGFDFEKTYGAIGHNFIEVHHSNPVSQMGEGYIVDPIKELFPVCSNCHSMLHKRKVPYTIDELKAMYKG